MRNLLVGALVGACLLGCGDDDVARPRRGVAGTDGGVAGSGGSATGGGAGVDSGAGTAGKSGSGGSGGAGAGAGSSGSGGTGGSSECSMPDDCPAPSSECVTRTCTTGKCGTSAVASGTPTTANQTPADCKRVVCDGAGSTQQAADANDIEDDANPCTIDWCNAGTPTHDAVAVGTRCNTTGYCDAQKRCVACLAPSDCGTATDCATPTCTNGVCGTNFTSDGTPIGTQTAGDCKRKVCDGAGVVSERADNADLPNDNNTCTADTCSSGAPVFTPTPNQACGTNGICSQQGQCVGCNAATDCTGSDDFCKTRTCLNNVCGVSYTPGDMPLPTQTAGDCATRVCDGQGGTRANPAPTDVNVDGNPCTLDQCAGTVPQNPPTPAGATCNVSGGKVCNGAGACVACLTPADCANPTGFPCVIATCSNNQCATASATRDTPCGPAPSCSSGVAQLQDKCIDGTCTDSGSQTCSPYVCGPSACTTSCVGDGGCSGGTGCDTGLGVCITGQKCTDYCDSIALTCTGTHAQYFARDACLRTCAKFPKGTPADASGNTLGCRITHESYARTMAPDVHCFHAGPAGYNGCGGLCENFCALALAVCPGTYASSTACMTECGNFPTTPTYYAGVTTGNSYACRLYQLTYATLDPVSFCPQITAASTSCL